MKLTKLCILPLATGIILAIVFLLEVPTAQSSGSLQNSSALDSSDTSDEVINIDVLKEGEVLVTQTRSRGIELISEARIVELREDFITIVKDENDQVVRVFRGLGDGADLVTYAVMPEADALELLESGGNIVEPLD